MINKLRLDQLIVNKKIFESKEKAKIQIMLGNILVDEKKIIKPGTMVQKNIKIRVLKNKKIYVSRGALKLKEAIKIFKINIKNKRCMDIGASTGGFTEILILNKASIVYSVDVGYNQLNWKLRKNNKIIILEKTNCRYLTLKQVGNILFDIIVVDVSFISLTKILKPIYKCLKKNGIIICLVKPQFEAKKEKVNKKGILNNKEEHKNVINNIIEFSINLNLSIKEIINSPIKGKKGNPEYFFYLKKDYKKNIYDNFILNELVEKSFSI